MEHQPSQYDPNEDYESFVAWKDQRFDAHLAGNPTAAESIAAMQEVINKAGETAARMWLHDVETPEDL